MSVGAEVDTLKGGEVGICAVDAAAAVGGEQLQQQVALYLGSGPEGKASYHDL